MISLPDDSAEVWRSSPIRQLDLSRFEVTGGHRGGPPEALDPGDPVHIAVAAGAVIDGPVVIEQLENTDHREWVDGDEPAPRQPDPMADPFADPLA